MSVCLGVLCMCRWANRPFYRTFVENVIAEYGYGDADGVQIGKTIMHVAVCGVMVMLVPACCV